MLPSPATTTAVMPSTAELEAQPGKRRVARGNKLHSGGGHGDLADCRGYRRAAWQQLSRPCALPEGLAAQVLTHLRPVRQVLSLKQLAARVLHQAGFSAESLQQAGYPDFVYASIAETPAPPRLDAWRGRSGSRRRLGVAKPRTRRSSCCRGTTSTTSAKSLHDKHDKHDKHG